VVEALRLMGLMTAPPLHPKERNYRPPESMGEALVFSVFGKFWHSLTEKIGNIRSVKQFLTLMCALNTPF
jgi:hypothetical protein